MVSVAVMLTCCVESFDLPVNGSAVRFLVVDGFLNTTNGEVNVNLRRSVKITESEILFEANAVVMLEDSEGNQSPLNELDPGRYQGTAPAPGAERQFRLYIKTADGKEYRSHFVTQKITPEIKAVSWKATADGTQLTVDTGDETNNTRYYRWTFEETWEYHARYTSYCTLVVNDTIYARPRNPEEMIDICYRTQPSAQIYSTTTSGLTKDVVNDFELGFLPKGTEKLGYQYSVLVRQYAISEETYGYLEKLKKTSQDLDGLYAPQPSQVTGNIVSISDPSEIVLGYFDAGQATEKRIFLTPMDLPAYLRTVTPDQTIPCYIDTVENKPDKLLAFSASKDHLLLEPIHEDFSVSDYTYTRKECTDCRLKGGVTVKPVFWP